MAHSAPPDAKVLGISERDLFIPMLTFVFGQAQMDGQYALVSTARLRQEFYGLPGMDPLLDQRLIKEACHELGHAFGLAHCGNAACPMSLSTTIRHVDSKSTEYCDGCAAHVLRRGLVLREQVT
jgi:archaemetzincin